MNIDWKNFHDKLMQANSVLLSTHKNADGDGLGSEIAMFYYLKSLNKDVRIINCTEISSRYKYMDPDSIVETYATDDDLWISNLDLAVVFDLGDYARLSDVGEKMRLNNIDTINLDHHHTNDESIYEISIIDTKSPSTTYLVWKYFDYLDMNNAPLDDKIALALYSGLVNDTGSFRYSSVTFDTHNMASHLMTSKIDPNMVFQNIYENKTIEQIKLLSEMIRNIKFNKSGKVGYVNLDEVIFKKTGASPYDADGFADYIRGIHGVEVSFCITSFSSYSKISFRSRGKYAINDIAQKFGGGGHYFAAGCEVDSDNIDKIILLLLKQIEEKISNVNQK